MAEVGFGPQGSDPRTTPDWSWYPADWNADYQSNQDEYRGNLIISSLGVYSYTFRFSDDDGRSFVYADYIPGTVNGFSTSDLGTITVTAD